MGLWDHLWDDVAAGPWPDSGFGKLRKFCSLGSRSTSGKEWETTAEQAVRVTRSITIIKPPGYQPGSTPASPAGSTPPVSPFADPSKEPLTRLRRRSASDAYAYEQKREIIMGGPFDI